MKPVLVILLLAAFSSPAMTRPGVPQPPCESAMVSVYPGYATPDEPPAVVSWRGRELADAGWRPPSCTGWRDLPRPRLVVALAGSFRFAGSVDDLLSRIGAISAFRGVLYWSVANSDWRPLARDASALRSQDPRIRRPDFDGVEMRPGQDLFYAQRTSLWSGESVFGMRVRESGPDSAVVEIENVSAITFFFLTTFDPGSLRSLWFLERLSPGIWAAYGLTEAGEGASAFAIRDDAPYVNRAMAIYRHIAGILVRQ